MKYEFAQNVVPSTGMCRQEGVGSAEFGCLFIYPYGVPNFVFTVSLSFAKDGHTGNIDIVVDPLKSILSTRSLF